MSAYRYRAARSDGAIVTGSIDARAAGEATLQLAHRGLFALQVTATDDNPSHSPAPRRDLAIVFRGLATLVAAGVPLEASLRASEVLTRGRLRAALAAVCSAVREGQSFAQALAGTNGTIPTVVIGMIRAGERGSALSPALTEVAHHLELEADLSGRVRQALAYPAMLAAAGTLSVIVIGTVVVPRFAELLGDLGQDLPPATRLLLSGTAFATRFWLVGTAFVLAGLVTMANWLRRPGGKRALHRVLHGLPVIGPLRLSLAGARVARSLGGMIAAGMPLLAALDAAREAAGDSVVAERLARVRELVAEGDTLAAALERARALPPAALQLVAIGESSGRLAELTRRAGDLSAQEAERGLRAAVLLLEPTLIAALGAVVGFVAVAMLQAVYAVRPG